MEFAMRQVIDVTIVAISASLCVACATVAAHDPMSAYYSNTLHETRANGTQSWFLFNADHTFRSTNQDGKAITGSWTLNAQSETCISIDGSDRPPPPCAKLQAKKIGDNWDRQGPAGNEHFVLEAGRK